MTPDAVSSSSSLVSASGLLLGTLIAAMGAGALVGLAAGSWPLGVLGGAIAGIPGGAAAVYFRYRDFFSA